MASTEECVDLQGSEDVEGSVDRCGTGTIQHSASNLAKQLLEDRAAQYCSCDVVGKGSFPGGRGGRDMARDTRGRMEQEKLLMQSESREVEDGTSTCRGRMGSGQVEEREDSSTESRETVNETQPYHVHIVKHCPNGDPALTFVPEPEANSKGHFIRLPVIVSKYWGPDQYQADNPGRCLVKAIVALGTLLLVAVICFLAGYFTVKFPNEESTISSWKGPVRVKVETSLRQHYVTAYNDRNSPQYRDFSRNFSKAVDDVFMDSSLQNEFSHCTVDRLRRGSVLVEFTIHLHGPPTSSNTELNPSGDAELTTRQAVMEVLRDAVASGQLDTLNVDGESIRVTRVLIGVSYGSISSPPTPELTSLLKREPGLVNQLGCGTRLGDTSRLSRILGGTDAMPGRWPWLGSIQYQFGDELAHRCAASLLNPEWAITAAHCVDGGVGDILVHIVFGDNDLGGSSPSRQTVHVERIMVHPGFSISWHDNDLALLKLRQRVRFDENVSPACVETEPHEVERYQECYIAGWGHTQENGNISRTLQEVEIPLVGKSLCSDQFRSPTLVAHRVITDNMICAGKATGGVDSCQSDSGGPLMCLGDDGSWRIVGLTSFGYGCGRPDYSGVYTRVSRYWDYLTSVVRGEPSITCEELTDPICRSRLPYTTVFPSSQEDLSLSTILNNTSGHAQPASQMVMSSSSRELMETLLCLTLFASCESSGELPLVPCRQFCQSAMNIHFSIVARCDKYPDGPARDTMFCRKGINADCGPTHLYPTTTNHSNIISPYYPAALFNYRTVGCTWLVTGPSCTAVIFKFTELKLLLADRGKIITIGSGNDPQNRSSGLYKFFGLSVPSPRVVHSNLAWMSFSSVSDLFDDPQEAFQFSVEVHVAEVRQQDVTDDVCVLGLGDCTENELCFPSWWRCDGITDCSGGEDEADCAASTKQVNTTETTITP